MKLSSTEAKNSFNYIWLLKRMFPFIKPYLFRIFIGFLVALPLGMLDGVTAYALKPYMDFVINGKTFDYTIAGYHIVITSLQMAVIIPFGIVIFTAIQGLLHYINEYICSWTSIKISNDVKIKLFERLAFMHPKFFDENPSGIVFSRYFGDPQIASAGLIDQIKTIVTTGCSSIGLVAVMLYSSWKLAIVGVLVLLCAFLPLSLLRKKIKKTSNQNMVIAGDLTTLCVETYAGNKVVTAYELQNRQITNFNKMIRDFFNVNISLTKRMAWMSPMTHLISSVGVAAVLGYGTYLINSHQMTSGSFASFIASLLLLYRPVKAFGHALTNMQTTFVAMSRTFELFDIYPEIKNKENPIELKAVNKEISFENVVFEYEENTPVLKNINLTVKKGETIAIVGNSGGGKSTLVNLLPRFYDIKSGSIKIDDTDIRDLSLDSLRHNISIVFQDNFLFTGTIRENIMMGNPQATEDELLAAVKSAHLEDLIDSHAEGLDTFLGERGLTLSGGQRQRVAIARAMLRNAPIVILDEATSALDNESEAIVQKAMDNLMKNRTVFIIAHRLSTIQNADRIAVINAGELVELGTHEELVNIHGGAYKALYDMQFRTQEKQSDNA